MEAINHVLVWKIEISLIALLVISELLTLAATWKATRKTAEVATTAPEVASMARSTTMFNVVGLGIGSMNHVVFEQSLSIMPVLEGCLC